MGDFFLARAAVPLFLLLLSSSPSPVAAACASHHGIGDSYTDTGNNPVAYPWYGIPNPDTHPPYGSTFFNRPTGRYCNGHLVIDFIGACPRALLSSIVIVRRRSNTDN
jgi:hypothetical protein